MKKNILPLLLAAFCLPVAHAQKTTQLFNGKDLTGWHIQSGSADTYVVKDGVIVGTSAQSSSNSFLVTDKTYGDFVLELEFKVDSTQNSGIQVRSESTPDYESGRVHGYKWKLTRATGSGQAAFTMKQEEAGYTRLLTILMHNQPLNQANGTNCILNVLATTYALGLTEQLQLL